MHFIYAKVEKWKKGCQTAFQCEFSKGLSGTDNIHTHFKSEWHKTDGKCQSFIETNDIKYHC